MGCSHGIRRTEGIYSVFLLDTLSLSYVVISIDTTTTKTMELFPKVPENLVREIVRNFNKLVKDLQSQESPEAMAYLRIMGVELGYIKGNELKSIAYQAMMYAEIFMKIIPTTVLFCTRVIHFK